MYALVWSGRIKGDAAVREAHAQRDAIDAVGRIAGLRSLQVVIGANGILLATAAFDGLEQARKGEDAIDAFLRQALAATLDEDGPNGAIVAVWIAREVGEDATYASGQPIDADE
jgi:hypothetical protein